MLTKPLKGETEEERSDRRILHKEVLKSVLAVHEDEKDMEKVWKDYDKNSETREEYIVNRRKKNSKSFRSSWRKCKVLYSSFSRTNKKRDQCYPSQRC